MGKFLKMEAEGKEYFIGFSNRASITTAARAGMEKTLRNADKLDSDETMVKMIRYGMLEKQPKITEKEVSEILDKYISENVNDEECVDISQIIEFISEQYKAFSGLPTGEKKVKKLEVVEI